MYQPEPNRRRKSRAACRKQTACSMQHTGEGTRRRDKGAPVPQPARYFARGFSATCSAILGRPREVRKAFRSASSAVTYWFRLTPSRSASSARRSCNETGRRTRNLPEYSRSSAGSGISAPSSNAHSSQGRKWGQLPFSTRFLYSDARISSSRISSECQGRRGGSRQQEAYSTQGSGQGERRRAKGEGRNPDLVADLGQDRRLRVGREKRLSRPAIDCVTPWSFISRPL